MSCFLSCAKKERCYFKVEGGKSLVATPVALDVSKLMFNTFKLYNEGKEVACQVNRETNTLWFMHLPGQSTSYMLEEEHVAIEQEKELLAVKENGSLHLTLDNRPLLQYRYDMHYPPEGVDSIFRKSGYIHPVITPKGDTLTRINPPDHYHHYGIWGPWTHTQIDSVRVDFWNLGDGQGTVLFKEFESIERGAVYNAFNAVQEHIDLKTKDAPQVALNENLKVSLWNLGRDDRYMFDYSSSFSSSLEEGVLFEAYRYGGGLGMRFHERWHKDNCKVLTSEGMTRLNADGTNARWVIVSGENSRGDGTNGILFMSHPDNRMHPEPMRVWPIDANNGRGDMFFEFCPIRHKEWKIEPDKTYDLKYRMVVFDGELTANEAEAYWQAFASTPQIKIVSH
ncbi:PmoA family protein [Snuella sp. CAU 1569]|uniref:PmoA family protein n=2 Tax=Snuella sedimenti TaxID=2798802 RepID=A0A8J7LTH6_9FLAO|nr:PmoA family protein [Snuella sedimenti]MBJ6368376.1 PmoA family protein [Snuella sedimenti]